MALQGRLFLILSLTMFMLKRPVSPIPVGIEVNTVLSESGSEIVKSEYWQELSNFMTSLDAAEDSHRSQLLVSYEEWDLTTLKAMPHIHEFLVPPDLLDAIENNLGNATWLADLAKEYLQQGGHNMGPLMDLLASLGQLSAKENVSVPRDVLEKLCWRALSRWTHQAELQVWVSDAVDTFFESEEATSLQREDPSLFTDYIHNVFEHDWIELREILQDTIAHYKLRSEMFERVEQAHKNITPDDAVDAMTFSDISTPDEDFWNDSNINTMFGPVQVPDQEDDDGSAAENPVEDSKKAKKKIRRKRDHHTATTDTSSELATSLYLGAPLSPPLVVTDKELVTVRGTPSDKKFEHDSDVAQVGEANGNTLAKGNKNPETGRESDSTKEDDNQKGENAKSIENKGVKTVSKDKGTRTVIRRGQTGRVSQAVRKAITAVKLTASVVESEFDKLEKEIEKSIRGGEQPSEKDEEVIESQDSGEVLESHKPAKSTRKNKPGKDSKVRDFIQLKFSQVATLGLEEMEDENGPKGSNITTETATEDIDDSEDQAAVEMIAAVEISLTGRDLLQANGSGEVEAIDIKSHFQVLQVEELSSEEDDVEVVEERIEIVDQDFLATDDPTSDDKEQEEILEEEGKDESHVHGESHKDHSSHGTGHSHDSNHQHSHHSHHNHNDSNHTHEDKHYKDPNHSHTDAHHKNQNHPHDDEHHKDHPHDDEHHKDHPHDDEHHKDHPHDDEHHKDHQSLDDHYNDTNPSHDNEHHKHHSHDDALHKDPNHAHDEHHKYSNHSHDNDHHEDHAHDDEHHTNLTQDHAHHKDHTHDDEHHKDPNHTHDDEHHKDRSHSHDDAQHKDHTHDDEHHKDPNHSRDDNHNHGPDHSHDKDHDEVGLNQDP